MDSIMKRANQEENSIEELMFADDLARGRVVSALDCEAEGRWFESHSGQWLENSLCSPSG